MPMLPKGITLSIAVILMILSVPAASAATPQVDGFVQMSPLERGMIVDVELINRYPVIVVGVALANSPFADTIRPEYGVDLYRRLVR